VIAEAIQAGLSNPNPKPPQEKRRNRVDVWVTRRMVDELKRLASTHTLPQQTLLRHFLHQYLAGAPWKNNPAIRTENQTPEQDAVIL
jgi:hypothetical protein